MTEIRPYSWTPDGTTVAVAPLTPGTGPDIGVVLVEGTGDWEALIQTPTAEYEPAISPNGRWVAYRSRVTGQDEVYVDRFPDLGDRQPVSVDGGVLPTWSPDGRELMYVRSRQGRSLMRVSVEESEGPPASLVLGAPERLLDYRYAAGTGRRTYDLAPDGERFLMITNGPGDTEGESVQINVVLNWSQELLERVPVN